jgi:hypothetical protein
MSLRGAWRRRNLVLSLLVLQIINHVTPNSDPASQFKGPRPLIPTDFRLPLRRFGSTVV